MRKTKEQFREEISRAFYLSEARTGKTGKTKQYLCEHILRKNTRKTYESQALTFAEFLNAEYQVTDFPYIKPGMSEHFIGEMVVKAYHGEMAVSSVKTTIHALAKLQDILRHQKDYRIRIINKEKQLGRLRALNMKRSAFVVSEVKANRISESVAIEMILVFRHGTIVRSKLRDTMADVLEFQLFTGSRISAVFRLAVEDLDFATCMVTFRHDKGNKTRTVEVDPDYMQKLQRMVEGKKPGRQVFEMFDRKGQLSSIENSVKRIERWSHEVAEALGVRGANTHSYRKVFAQHRYEMYQTLSKTQLKKRIAKRVREDETGRIGQRISKYGRDMSIEKMAALLTSMDLGHNRLDVLVWYLNRTEDARFSPSEMVVL